MKSNLIRGLGILFGGLMLGLSGCLMGVQNDVRRDGNYVADTTLKQVTPGKTNSAWIRATLGEPSKTTTISPGHELWEYSYRETRHGGGYVFLIFGASDRKEVDGKVYVELEDGTVTKTWRG
jgi:outer membrane protein assembly factor BamE (lipoprotein component of BamABCDE complex)